MLLLLLPVFFLVLLVLVLVLFLIVLVRVFVLLLLLVLVLADLLFVALVHEFLPLTFLVPRKISLRTLNFPRYGTETKIKRASNMLHGTFSALTFLPPFFPHLLLCCLT